VHRVELDDLGGDLLPVPREGLGGENVAEVDEAVFAETGNCGLGEAVRGIELSDWQRPPRSALR
jgi:hypothetical protein